MKSTSSEFGSEGMHSVCALSAVTPLWISFYGFPKANVLSYSLLASKDIIFMHLHYPLSSWAVIWRQLDDGGQNMLLEEPSLWGDSEFQSGVLPYWKLSNETFHSPPCMGSPNLSCHSGFVSNHHQLAGSWARSGCEAVAHLLGKHVGACRKRGRTLERGSRRKHASCSHHHLRQRKEETSSCRVAES